LSQLLKRVFLTWKRRKLLFLFGKYFSNQIFKFKSGANLKITGASAGSRLCDRGFADSALECADQLQHFRQGIQTFLADLASLGWRLGDLSFNYLLNN
jgi:hypothetical protein